MEGTNSGDSLGDQPGNSPRSESDNGTHHVNRKLEAALAYAAMGIPVLPLYEVDETAHCVCHAKGECKSPGKHPRIHDGGRHRATTEEDQIRKWWGMWPNSNIGGTLDDTPYVALDPDVKDGKIGLAELARFEAEHGVLPKTRTHRTGSGGEHRLFRHKQGAIFIGCIPGYKDIDVIKNGLIVLPPSNHKSGGTYEVIDPRPAVMIPDHLDRSIRRAEREHREPVEQPDGGWTDEQLADIAAPVKAAIKVLARADGGSRNGTCNWVCYTVGRAAHAIQPESFFDEIYQTGLDVGMDMRRSPPRPGEIREQFDRVVQAAIDKIAAEREQPIYPRAATKPRGKLKLRALSEVPMERIDWIWKGWIPRGMISFVDGAPKGGKTSVLLDLIARMTRGEALPYDESDETQTPGHCIVVTAEDSIAQTIAPRLKAMGAQLGMVAEIVGTEHVQLPDDLGQLETLIREHKTQLVMFDPFAAFVGCDPNADVEIRKILTPLKQMAERTGCAIVFVRHLNKKEGLSAINRGAGSIGITGAARSVMACAPDPDNKDHHLLMSVAVNGTKQPRSLRYRIEGAAVMAADRTEIETSRIVWCDASPRSADEVLQGRAIKSKSSTRDEAASFLRHVLAKERCPIKTVFDDGAQLGISKSTIKRARKGAGVRAYKDGDVWYYELPPAARAA